MSITTETGPQESFASLLPELTSRANAVLADQPADKREEGVQEIVCRGWANWLSAWQRGKAEKLTPYHMVVYAHQGYKAGKRFCGSKVKDAMSEKARFRGRCNAIGFDDIRPQFRLHEILAAPRAHNQPDEQARINMDYKMILKQPGISERARKVWDALLDDNGPGHVKRIAAEQDITAAMVCQAKGELARLLAIYGYLPEDFERRRKAGKKRSYPELATVSAV